MSSQKFTATDFPRLSSKAALTAAAGVLIAAFLLSGAFFHHLEGINLDDLMRRTDSSSDLLARLSVRGVQEGDPSSLSGPFSAIFREPTVLHASVVGVEGEIARRTAPLTDGMEALLATHPAGAEVVRSPASRTLRSIGRIRVLDAVTPVVSSPGSPETIGAVRIITSLARFDARRDELRRRVIPVALGLALAAAAATALLVGRIVAPIRGLARAAERIAHGDYSATPVSASRDEIGTLTASFSRMAAGLRQARENQARWNRDLEQRVAEKTREIVETKNHLSTILESVDESILVADLDGTIISANTHTREIFGENPDLISGRDIGDFTRDPDRNAASIARMLRDGPESYETEERTPAGERRDLLVTHAFLHDAGGEAAGLIQVTRDITKLKAMEQRLVRSQRLSAMGEMAGEIGHELNNYLSAIGGRAELIPMALSRGRQEAVVENARTIARQISRMRVLTDGLLDSARRGSHPVNTDLNGIVERTISFLGPCGRQDGIRFEPALHPSPLTIHADDQQIQQVFLNLLGNGADATRAAGRTDEAVVVETFERDGFAWATVIDRGIGMTDSVRERIFDPHFTTKADGHGFGLAVCHRVVEGHGGQIDVESEPGNGARFTVRLPLAGCEATPVRENPDLVEGTPRRATHPG
ncbi:MAG: ATP-binding protein [Gemmatimonadota bacterium]|nr:hypothetical protein [Gemmatimonadota bacterium]MDP6529004.1 ATP-binding protein [Gemmatimonadota bacterium]